MSRVHVLGVVAEEYQTSRQNFSLKYNYLQNKLRQTFGRFSYRSFLLGSRSLSIALCIVKKFLFTCLDANTTIQLSRFEVNKYISGKTT